ncbi:MAG: hypothetical protein P0116_15500, partial [Candidatus Nitrosocosmicus sp.]|nr:hypothetical protein [Candidatus Nitrosocosmicus sp.]
MFRKIDVGTIAARFFHKGGMLSNQDYFRSLPYRAMKIVNRDLKINKINIAGISLFLDDKDSLNLAWHRV